VGTVCPGNLQLLQQAMGGFCQDAEVAFDGFNGDGIGEMTFSCTGWSHISKFSWRWMKTQAGQILDQDAVDAGCSREIEMSQCFAVVASG